MKATDMITESSDSFIVNFNDELFGEIPGNMLVIPCPAYVPIFRLANHLFNNVLDDTAREAML